MRNNILIPKYNELDQSPPSCFNTRCINNHITQRQSPPSCFNKRCINKHITQGQSPPIYVNTHCVKKHITREKNLDEYYYNKYVR